MLTEGPSSQNSRVDGAAPSRSKRAAAGLHHLLQMLGAAAAPALGARQGLHPALQHIKSRALSSLSPVKLFVLATFLSA